MQTIKGIRAKFLRLANQAEIDKVNSTEPGQKWLGTKRLAKFLILNADGSALGVESLALTPKQEDILCGESPEYVLYGNVIGSNVYYSLAGVKQASQADKLAALKGYASTTTAAPVEDVAMSIINMANTEEEESDFNPFEEEVSAPIIGGEG